LPASLLPSTLPLDALDRAPKDRSVGSSCVVVAADGAAAGDVLMRIENDRVRLVDLVFSDISGGAKALTIPAELLPPTLDHGYRFDGSALTGGLRKVELDLYLVPDPDTLVIHPPESDASRGSVLGRSEAGNRSPQTDRQRGFR
jgi:glutamine synthetase